MSKDKRISTSNDTDSNGRDGANTVDKSDQNIIKDNDSIISDTHSQSHVADSLANSTTAAIQVVLRQDEGESSQSGNTERDTQQTDSGFDDIIPSIGE